MAINSISVSNHSVIYCSFAGAALGGYFSHRVITTIESYMQPQYLYQDAECGGCTVSRNHMNIVKIASVAIGSGLGAMGGALFGVWQSVGL